MLTTETANPCDRLAPAHLLDVMTSNNRERVISWLCWHDPNGVYTDEDSEAEGMSPLTLDEARQIMRDQLAENADEIITLT